MSNNLKKLKIRDHKISYTDEPTYIDSTTRKYDIIIDIDGTLFDRILIVKEELFVKKLEELVIICEGIRLKSRRK